MAKYLNLAGLQTLWTKAKNTFALKSHNHKDNIDDISATATDAVTDNMDIVTSNANRTADVKVYRRSVTLLWNYIKSKLGISSAVGSTTNPVYVDSNGQLKAVGGTMLKQGSLIDTHSEGSRTILIDGTNELFAFYDRGGTCTAYEYDLEWSSSSPAPAGTFSPADLSSHKTTASVANISANVFNSLTGYNQSTVYSGTKYAVYDLKLPASFSYGTTFYWSFGNANWKPHYFEVLVWKDNATQYPNGYISKYRSTNVGAYGSVAVGVGATEGNSFTHIRIVMDKYSRLAAFGVVNYSSTGLATNYMSRTVDRSLYRNITVAKNNTYDLGSSSSKWANIYATNFNGALKGNADTATKALALCRNNTTRQSSINLAHESGGTGNALTRVDQVTSAISATNGRPDADGFVMTFNWDTTAPYDTQIFIPNGSGANAGIPKIRFRDNKSEWGAWGELNIGGNAATASAAKSGSALETAINARQDKLTPGTNIAISGNTISATDTTYAEASKDDVEKIVTDLT